MEQLPLYLHRTYALVRELDEQITGKPLVVSRYGHEGEATHHDCLGRHNEILPSLQKYIRLRRSLARREDSKPLDEHGHPLVTEDMQLSDTNSDVKPETTGEINGTHFCIGAYLLSALTRCRDHTWAPATYWLVDRRSHARISREGRPCASRLRLRMCSS